MHLTFHIILHTHWDREWYLPHAAFHARLVPAFDDVLELLDREADARFVADGQTVLVEDLLEIRPEWIARVAGAVAGGQLEVGPWYVLADEIVPSGESLVRNLLQGARDTAALGGRMDVLYSPDAFGHPATLPTLAREFGIGAAVVWRGLASPGGVDRDLYQWQGPDGSAITLYHLPPSGYEIGADLTGAEEQLTERWGAIRSQLVARAATSHIAIFVGADHHAPPRDPGALRDALQAIEAGHDVRLSSLAAFAAAAAAGATALAQLAGELRWSYGHTWTLQGTFATRARLKRRHAAVELHLQRVVEPLAALATWHCGTDQQAILRHATRTLLACQFHDTLCGCCSDDVAREQESRLTSLAAMDREIARAALNAITGHDPDLARESPARITPALLLWNLVPRTRGGIVTAEVTFFRRDVLVGPPTGRAPRTGPGYVPFVLVAPDGRHIPVQVLSVAPGTERIDARRHYPDQDEVDRVLVAFDSPPVAGLGFLALTPIAAPALLPEAGLEVHDGRIANRFVEVHLTPDGRFDMIDRRSDEHYPNIFHLVDEQDHGDTYTPFIRTSGEPSAPLSDVQCSVLAEGPLVGALEMRFVVPSIGHGEVAGRLVLVLHADSPVLRARIEIDNRATDHRLRFRVPIGVGASALAGAAFGFERRNAIDGDDGRFPAESPTPTAPAHRFVAAGHEGRGLAVFSPGFFEYEWTSEHEIFVTALRSVGELSRDTLPPRPGHAGWPMRTPDAQELGYHVMELGVTPLAAGDLDEPARLERVWEETFVAPQPTFVRDFVGDLAAARSIDIELEGRGLVFTALKVAEQGDGTVLRCYNSGATTVTGRWTIGTRVARAILARADETPLRALDVARQSVIAFEAPARGLVTIIVYPCA
jgi:mannosylglycerate hydrolase